MTKTTLILAALALSASATHIDSAEMKLLWNTWKSLNNKQYNSNQEVKKFSAFVQNFIKVTEHNKQNSDVKFALNKFADLTEEEFTHQYLRGLKVDEFSLNKTKTSTVDYSILATPAEVDWRTKGAVTPVKDQGQCGTCWSFSTTGALEGLNFIKTGKLLSFSEQQLVSCDKQQGQDCESGGLMSTALEYVAQNGIELEENYPYTSGTTQEIGTCNYDASKTQKINKGHSSVAQTADALKAAIAIQPVAIAVTGNPFQHYKSGVLKAECTGPLNHGVLAVGYIQKNGEEAYVVKNSWTDGWGEKGYAYVSTDPKFNSGAGACKILNNFNVVPTA